MTSSFNRYDIRTWVAALRDDHLYPRSERTVAYHIARLTSLPTFKPSDWAILLNNQLLSAILDILCDDYIGGFTKSELLCTSPKKFHEQILRPYIIRVLAIFTLALQYLYGLCQIHQEKPTGGNCSRCAIVERFAAPLKTRYAAFLRAIWDVADPLLVHEGNIVCDFIGGPDTFYFNLYDTILHSNLHFDLVYQKCVRGPLRDNLKEAMYRSAHLMLVIWIHSRLINTRQTALVRLITALRLTYEGRMSAPYDVFFKEVTSGCITAVELYKTVANDLRQDGPFHPLEEFEVFDSLIKCAMQLRAEDTITISTPTERAMLWYTLAAGRRQLCSTMTELGPAEKAEHDEARLTHLCIYLCKIVGIPRRPEQERPLLPKLWMLAMVPMFSRIIVTSRHVADFLVAGHKLLHPAFCEISRVLRYYRYWNTEVSPHHEWWQEPPSPATWRFTLKVWRRAEEKLVAHNIPNTPVAKELYLEWVKIGRELEHGENTTWNETGSFELLKRCSWEDCPCSAFRPSHRLRKCTRCHLVAYCNSRCQREDWSTHKRECF